MCETTFNRIPVNVTLKVKSRKQLEVVAPSSLRLHHSLRVLVGFHESVTVGMPLGFDASEEGAPVFVEQNGIGAEFDDVPRGGVSGRRRGGGSGGGDGSGSFRRRRQAAVLKDVVVDVFFIEVVVRTGRHWPRPKSRGGECTFPFGPRLYGRHGESKLL